jgi:hypothetical protein
VSLDFHPGEKSPETHGSDPAKSEL